MWLEVAAGSAAEAGGHPAPNAEGVEDEQVWEEWESGDWIEGTGTDGGAGVAVAAAVEAEVSARAVEQRLCWLMVQWLCMLGLGMQPVLRWRQLQLCQ